MKFLDALASNPLPTSIAVVIAIAAILGYYFFVIPLMDDHKKLKEKSNYMEKELELLKTKGDERFIQQLDEINNVLAALRESIDENDTDRLEKFKKVEEFVATSSKYQSEIHTKHGYLHTQVEEISRSIQKITEVTQALNNSSKIHDDSVNRVLSEANRNMQSINEKQSQILGALLGMGRLQDRNKGI